MIPLSGTGDYDGVVPRLFNSTRIPRSPFPPSPGLTDMSALKFACPAAALAAVLLIGCSGAEGDTPVDVHPVTGKVTLNGAPVAGASVTFSPKSNQPVATGRTDDSGTYTLTTYASGDGAAAGDYVALVYKNEVDSSAASGPAPHDPNNPTPKAHGGPSRRAVTKSLVPKKYGSADESDLKVTVKEGENNIPLDLKP